MPPRQRSECLNRCPGRLLFDCQGDIEVVKFTSRVVVWRQRDQPPALWDVDGHGDRILPTIFTLWKYPEALPCLWTFPQVTTHILRGADLMLPGVIQTPEGFDFLRGTALCIRAVGNPAPVALGFAAVSADEAVASKMTGKGLSVIHRYRDALWEFGGKGEPNEGFGERSVSAVSGALEEMDAAGDDFDAPVEESAGAGGAGAAEEEDKGEEDVVGDWEEAAATAEAEDAAAAAADAEEAEESAAVEEHPRVVELRALSAEQLMEQVFLQALVTRVKPATLPISFPDLFEQHMLACCPAGLSLPDIKTTSWKKWPKFAQAMKKKKIVKVQDKGGEARIVEVLHKVTFIKHFDPWPAELEAASKGTVPAPPASGAASGRSDARGGAGGSGGGAPPPAPPAGPIVRDWFKPTKETLPVFAAAVEAGTPGLEGVQITSRRGRAGGLDNSLFTGEQVRNAALAYMKLANMTDPTEPSKVVLDPILTDALFKGAVKKGDRYPTHVTKKQVVQLLAKRCQGWHSVEQGGEVNYSKGAVVPIEIEVKKVRGRNTTFVRNSSVYGLSAKEMGKVAQHAFQCSTTVQPNSHKPTEEETVIQGDCSKKLGALLASKFGVPDRCLKVINRLKKP